MENQVCDTQVNNFSVRTHNYWKVNTTTAFMTDWLGWMVITSNHHNVAKFAMQLVYIHKLNIISNLIVDKCSGFAWKDSFDNRNWYAISFSYSFNLKSKYFSLKAMCTMLVPISVINVQTHIGLIEHLCTRSTVYVNAKEISWHVVTQRY